MLSTTFCVEDVVKEDSEEEVLEVTFQLEQTLEESNGGDDVEGGTTIEMSKDDMIKVILDWLDARERANKQQCTVKGLSPGKQIPIQVRRK